MADTEQIAATEDGSRPAAGNRRLAAWHGAAAAALAVLFAAALNLLVGRIGLVREEAFVAAHPLSGRTRQILARADGPLRVVCFLDRNSPLSGPVGRLLRGFRAAAAAAGGTAIDIAYVDPRRDLSEAAVLAAADVPPNSLLFEGRGRRLVVPAADLLVTNAAGRAVFRGENVCAAAIARLGRPGQPVVYWLRGHDEGDNADYDPQAGFSAIAREIRHEGYDLRPIELWTAKCVPADADALVVAGPHRALAAEEVAWIEAYLTRGGRLLVLADPARTSGLEGTLERWGLRVTAWTAVSRDTLSGHDALIRRYGDHPIVRGLTNTVTVFLGSRCLQAAPAGAGGAADRARYTALALTGDDGFGVRGGELRPRLFDPREDLPGPVTVAAALERGGEAGRDIALQPTRIVVFGERAFVANAMLTSRSSANRDLFLNALNWLTGADVGSGAGDAGAAAFRTGLDRRGWIRFTLLAAVALPALVWLVGWLVALRRRSRV
jgi:hypothetical protein